MKRLKLLIIFFSLALCVPLAFFVDQTYRGLEQEEVATLRYFAETILDEMEQSLTALVIRMAHFRVRWRKAGSKCRLIVMHW
jgi:hypothetical protein